MTAPRRRAEVPRAGQALGEVVSKADLLEAAWHLASLCHDGGCDNEAMTYLRLREELDNARERQGRRPIKVKWTPEELGVGPLNSVAP